MALVLDPTRAWLYVFLSHMMVAAFVYHLASGLSIFSVAVLGWSMIVSSGVLIAYVVFVAIIVRQALKTGNVSMPFLLVPYDEE